MTEHTSALSSAQTRFIDEFAALYVTRGMPQNMGRLFGYLMLQPDPVPMDKIAADLALSKTSVWNLTRELVNAGHATRHGVTGSKQALYALSDDFTTPIEKMCDLLCATGMLLENGAETFAPPEVAEKLQQRSAFYFALQQALANAVDDQKEIQKKR